MGGGCIPNQGSEAVYGGVTSTFFTCPLASCNFCAIGTYYRAQATEPARAKTSLAETKELQCRNTSSQACIRLCTRETQRWVIIFPKSPTINQSTDYQPYPTTSRDLQERITLRSTRLLQVISRILRRADTYKNG